MKGTKPQTTHGSLPPAAGVHKSRVCNRKEWAKAAQRGEEITCSPPAAPGEASPQNPLRLLGRPNRQSASLDPVSRGNDLAVELEGLC